MEDLRLDFTLPEFVRIAWASELAKEYWEPRIRDINACWPIVERASIMHDIRSGAIQSIIPEQIPDIQEWSARTGIGMAILALEGSHGSYGNASIPYNPGQPFTYRVYFGQYP